MVRATRVERALSGWKPEVLPLDDASTLSKNDGTGGRNRTGSKWFWRPPRSHDLTGTCDKVPG